MTARKCRHARAARSYNITLATGPDGLNLPIEWQSCDACGERLSLGHSDETDPRVAIEIAAAWILGCNGFAQVAHVVPGDSENECLYRYSRDPDDMREDCDGCLIEQLIWDIAHHESGTP